MSTVLIVEDSAPLGQLVRDAANRAGHNAVWVDNGAAALNEVEALAPDVVLIDLNLGDIDGADLAEQIRELLPDARLVCISGEPPPEAIRQRFDHFALKPVSLQDLLGAIAG